MNAAPNRSHFNIVFRNCADFARSVLNFYFPGNFERDIVPDGGITTPRQVAYELERYARKHPGLQLKVMEIPLVPGYRRPSRTNESVSESLIVTGYVVPIAVLNPFVGAAVVVDALVWGRYPLPLRHAEGLNSEEIARLASSASIAWSKDNFVGQPKIAPAR